MSGSITSPNGIIWHAAGWVFRNVLDRTAEILKEQGNVSLAHRLMDEMSAIRLFEMLELSEFARKDQISFFKALRLCFQRYELEGSKSWRSAEFFPGFMERFKELVDILEVEEGEGGST